MMMIYIYTHRSGNSLILGGFNRYPKLYRTIKQNDTKNDSKNDTKNDTKNCANNGTTIPGGLRPPNPPNLNKKWAALPRRPLFIYR